VVFQGIFEDDKDPVYKSGVGSGWGPAYMDIRFTFAALDGRIGGAFYVSNGVGVGDELNAWAKPFGSDILYIKIGKTRDDKFRGPGTDNNFQGFIGGPGHDGDAIFNRFEPDHGALFISQPVTGLSLFAQLDATEAMTKIAPEIVGPEAKDVYKKIQAGLAYDIPGIGLARAQWVGNTMDMTVGGDYVFNGTTWEGADKPGTNGITTVPGWTWTPNNRYTANPARIEAAFKVKAIEGLNLDIGAKIPIPVQDEIGGVDVTYQGNFELNVAGDFTAGDFGLAYGLYGGFGGSWAVDIPGESRRKLSPTFDLILVPSFVVAAIDAKVGADIGFKVKGESDDPSTGNGNGDQSTIFGFGAWIQRSLGPGMIKTGLAYQLPAYGNNGIQGQTSYFSWPIILELHF
jgi:hypothetical protein